MLIITQEVLVEFVPPPTKIKNRRKQELFECLEEIEEIQNLLKQHLLGTYESSCTLDIFNKLVRVEKLRHRVKVLSESIKW